MKTIVVRCPRWVKNEPPAWDVSYETNGTGACRVVTIDTGTWKFSLVLSAFGYDTYISLPNHLTCVGPFRGSLAVKEVSDELFAAEIPPRDLVSVEAVLSDIEACTLYELGATKVLPGDELFLSEPHQHYIEPLLCDNGREYFMRYYLDPPIYEMLSRLKTLVGLPWYGLFGSCFLKGMAQWLCEEMQCSKDLSLHQIFNVLSGVPPYCELPPEADESSKEVSSNG